MQLNKMHTYFISPAKQKSCHKRMSSIEDLTTEKPLEYPLVKQKLLRLKPLMQFCSKKTQDISNGFPTLEGAKNIKSEDSDNQIIGFNSKHCAKSILSLYSISHNKVKDYHFLTKHFYGQ